ncbi:ABC transporter substrate-binding protein [Halolamina salifodinae]|uniref:Peptide/nickel transport system substrate-binding protein n=1 Tax=Halolamina salifodinae TaxID=1202767 RepID=A0A8T4GVQ7_9EURY|nr:ABC transporter substrate-binding protein [Halolamina salifodinae]MBP1986520.1 peptide/nickel transport system substrate-binding protein [Halolamina salifodinae]
MSDADGVQRRRFLKATGGLATAGVLAGCSSGGDSTPPEELGSDTPTESQETDGTETSSNGDQSTLRLINESANTLDPIATVLTTESEKVAQMFDGLVGKPHGTADITNLIAESVDVSDDGTVYTFTMREDVVAHNGDQIDANAVVYSWERLAASDNSTSDYVLLDDLGVTHETDDEGNYVPGSLGVEATGDYTVEVTLSSPYYAALDIMSDVSFVVLPEGIVGDIEGYEGKVAYDQFTSEPVGTGPFEFENWSPDNEASVTVYDDYYGEAPSIDRVHWQVMADPNAKFNHAMNRNVDVFPIPNAQYDSGKVTVEETDDIGRQIGTYGPLQNDETADYLRIAGLSTAFMLFNTNNVIEPARKAVAYVMNHEELSEGAYKGRLTPGYHMTPRSLWPGGPEAAKEHARENYPYGYGESDLESARQLMEDAGYSQSDPYQFEIINTPGATNDQISGRLRDQLSAAHIELTINTAEFSTLLDREFAGNRDSGLGSWGMAWADPMNVLALLYPENTRTTNHEGVSGAPLVGLNWTGTDASQRAREAWQTMQNNKRDTEEDRQIRAGAIRKLEEANWEDCALINYGYPSMERFSYDWVDMPMYGQLGALSKYTNVEIDTEAQPN